MCKVTNNTTDANFTCLQDIVALIPSQVFKAFGEPLEGDGEKVTAEWIFESDEGHIVTLYDWRSIPSALGAKDSDDPLVFHIGAHGSEGVALFKEWLRQNSFVK